MCVYKCNNVHEHKHDDGCYAWHLVVIMTTLIIYTITTVVVVVAAAVGAALISIWCHFSTECTWRSSSYRVK